MKLTNGVKMGIGIAGIVLVLGILLLVNSQLNTPKTESPSGDVQVVRIAVQGLDYVPSTVTVKAGTPVQFIVDGSNADGCVRYFVFKEFGISKLLDRGDNVFTFTPTQKGTFEFSCSMRMARGYMNVI